MEHSVKLEIGIKKNQPSSFTFSGQRKNWSFRLVVLQRTQINLQRFITHVHSHCSARLTFCLMTLPLPSWFSQTPYCVIGRGSLFATIVTNQIQRLSEMEWIGSLFLRDWSRKLAPPSQPIVCNDKTNRVLVSCEFPRLKAVSFNYPDFRLANCDTKLSSLFSSSLAVVTSLFCFMMPI